MKKREYVERINCSHVGEDCCQIMVAHDSNKYLTVVDSTGVTLYYDEKGRCICNDYLYDVRRFSFPNTNIPTYETFDEQERKVFAKQILDFNRNYLYFNRGTVISRCAVKNDEEGFLVTTIYKPDIRVETMTQEEVSEYIKSFDLGFINPRDGKITDYSFPSEEDLLERYKNNMRNLKSIMLFPNKNMNRVLEKDSDDLTLEDIPRDSLVFAGHFGIKTNGKDITDVKFITISFNEEDSYKVETLDFPLKRYTLEDVDDILKSQPTENIEEQQSSRTINRSIESKDNKGTNDSKEKVYKLQ